MLGAAGVRRVLAGRRAADRWTNACTGSITTPVNAPVTVPTNDIYCSTGAIVINDTVVINGAWRLT